MSGLQVGLGLLEKTHSWREPLRRLQWGQLKVATHKVSRFSEPLRSKTLVFPLPLKTGWTRLGPLASLRDRG